LGRAFIWTQTVEGFIYWDKLTKRCRSIELEAKDRVYSILKYNDFVKIYSNNF